MYNIQNSKKIHITHRKGKRIKKLNKKIQKNRKQKIK